MTQPDPESQTPHAKVLLPLGAAFIAVPILCMALWSLDPITYIMMIVLMVMGAGIFWQGTKNLKRDRA